jgi:hypothetical protein
LVIVTPLPVPENVPVIFLAVASLAVTVILPEEQSFTSVPMVRLMVLTENSPPTVFEPTVGLKLKLITCPVVETPERAINDPPNGLAIELAVTKASKQVLFVPLAVNENAKVVGFEGIFGTAVSSSLLQAVNEKEKSKAIAIK